MLSVITGVLCIYKNYVEKEKRYKMHLKTMKELRKKYEQPLVERTHVELEDGVCTAASAVVNEETRSIQAEAHQDGFDGDAENGDFTVGEWK